MQLQKILDEKIIDLKMNSKTKDEALRHLCQKLFDAGYIDNIEQFMLDIYEREKEGVTGIGNYIAIPHGKSDAVKKIGIAIGKCAYEIEWESLDDNGVKLIFLFAVNNDHEFARNHMLLLSEIARKLGNDQAVAKLQKVNEYDELLEIFV